MNKKILALILAVCISFVGTKILGKTFDKSVTITWITWHPDLNHMDDIAVLFNKKYPNITVKNSKYAYGEYIKLLKSGFASGAAEDVAGFQPGAHLGEYTEFLEPLAPWAEKDWGENWENKFHDFTIEQVKWSGDEMYMIPGAYNTTGVWANIRLLEKHGLSIPKNLSDLEKIRDTFKSETGIFGWVAGYSTNWNAVDTFQYIMDEYCPGLFYEAQAGNASFDDPMFVKSLETWKYLFDSKIIEPGAYGIPTYMDTVTGFLKGKSALMINGSWHVGSQYTNQFNVEGTQVGGVSPIYFPDLNGDGVQPRVSVTVDWGLGINKNIDEYRKAAAWELVKFITTGEGAKYYSKLFSGFPAAKEVVADKSAYEVNHYDVPEETHKELMNEFESSVKWFSGPRIMGAREPQYGKLKDGLYEILAAVATGQQTPKEGAKYLQKVSSKLKR